jgi:hypothetical protein
MGWSSSRMWNATPADREGAGRLVLGRVSERPAAPIAAHISS